MINFFNLVDFCSPGVELRMNGSTGQKSIIGGVVSLLVLIAVLFLIFYLGIDIVLKEKPRLIVSEIENTLPTFYNLTAKDFMFGFKIVDSTNVKVNYENYLDIIIMNSIGEKNATSETGPFLLNEKTYTEFDTCDKIKDYESFNISSTLIFFQCVKNLSLYLGGDFSDNKYGSLDFIVRPCRGRDTCKSAEELKEFLDKGLFMSIYYRDTMIDPKRADTPVQITHAPFLIGLSDLLQIDAYFNYKNLEIKSDFGFLFEDLKFTYTYKFENRELVYRSRGFRYLLWGTIFLKKKTMTFERRYLKIQEIAADIGGLFKFLWIVGIVFMYPISTKSINIDLTNEMFHFQPYGTLSDIEKKVSKDFQHKKTAKNNESKIIVNNYSTDKLNCKEEPNLRYSNSNLEYKNSENKISGIQKMNARLKLNKFKTSNVNLELAKNIENKVEVVPFSNTIKYSTNPNQSSSNYLSSQQNIISEQDKYNDSNNKLKLINNRDNNGLLIGTSKDEIIKSDIKSQDQGQVENINNEIIGKEECANDKSNIYIILYSIFLFIQRK